MLSSQLPALQQRLYALAARPAISEQDQLYIDSLRDQPRFNTFLAEMYLLHALALRDQPDNVFLKLKKMSWVLQLSRSAQETKYRSFLQANVLQRRLAVNGRYKQFVRVFLLSNCEFSPFIYFTIKYIDISASAALLTAQLGYTDCASYMAYCKALLRLVVLMRAFPVVAHSDTYQLQRNGAFKLEPAAQTSSTQYNNTNVAAQEPISVFGGGGSGGANRVNGHGNTAVCATSSAAGEFEAGEAALLGFLRRHSNSMQQAKIMACLEYLEETDATIGVRPCSVSEIRQTVTKLIINAMRGTDLDQGPREALQHFANYLMTQNFAANDAKQIFELLHKDAFELQLQDLKFAARQVYDAIRPGDDQPDHTAQIVCHEAQLGYIQRQFALDRGAAQAYMDHYIENYASCTNCTDCATAQPFCELPLLQRMRIPPLDIFNTICINAKCFTLAQIAEMREGRPIYAFCGREAFLQVLRHVGRFRRPKAARVYFLPLDAYFGVLPAVSVVSGVEISVSAPEAVEAADSASDPVFDEQAQYSIEQIAFQARYQTRLFAEEVLVKMQLSRARTRWLGEFAGNGASAVLFAGEIAAAHADLTLYVLVDSLLDVMFNDERCEGFCVSVNAAKQICAEFRFPGFAQRYVGAKMRVRFSAPTTVRVDGAAVQTSQFDVAATDVLVQWQEC